jgi:putative nucleotidyltransferase with HDIG domain
VSSTPRKSLPAAGRVFVGAVGLSGLGVVVASIIATARAPIPHEWIAFSIITLLTGNTLTFKVPSVPHLRLSLSEVFTFSCVLLYGPELATITATVEGLLHALRWRNSLTHTSFNLGNLSLSVWISGTLFFLVADIAPIATGPAKYGELILPLTVLAASFYSLNSGLTATVIAFEVRRQPLSVWREHFAFLAPTYAAGASIAFLLVMALKQLDFSAIVLIPPVLLILYLTMRSSFGRLEDSKAHVEKLNRMYLSTVETLATAIDAKDEVTHGHIRRVQGAALALAKEVGVTDEESLKAIEAAALLHDTGKIAVPEHILNKPGKLTEAEFAKMKLHAPIGADILSAIDFPYPVVPIVRHHHENWDGTGYPDGLTGTEIPLGARILSVVDCFDALTSDRPYRPRMTDEQALAILSERRGRMYDPVIVDAFISAHDRIMPPEAPPHPAARAVGDARRSGPATAEKPKAAQEPAVAGELLGVSSLARVVAGEASLADVGALCWMMLRQVVPCAAMGVFVPEERDDSIRGAYAAGVHAEVIRNLRSVPGTGVVGWSAANRRMAINAEPALDYGHHVTQFEPPLLSMVAVPLIHEGSVAAVVALYATTKNAFTEDQGRLLELLAPTLAASLAIVQAEHQADAPPAVQPAHRSFSEGGPRRARTAELHVLRR